MKTFLAFLLLSLPVLATATPTTHGDADVFEKKGN